MQKRGWILIACAVLAVLLIASTAAWRPGPENSQMASQADDSAGQQQSPTPSPSDATSKDADETVDNAASDTPVFDMTSWQLTLVNADHPLPEDYNVTLETVSNGKKFDVRAASALMAMLDAGNEQGLNLYICSAYRSAADQETLYKNRVYRWMLTGMDRGTAAAAAVTSVAYPGTSEHNMGLAVDILCSSYTSLTSGFGTTDAGIWLEEHCAEYGFVLRYPEDKTDLTGIIYEPWHFRYVGTEAASYIMEHDICFEEFWELFG